MEKFDIHSREFKIYPQMREKYDTYYQSLCQRDWRDMDEKYKDCLNERQYVLKRIKEVNKEINDNYVLINEYKWLIDEYCYYEKHKIIRDVSYFKNLIIQDIKHKKDLIKNLREELDILKNHYFPLLKIVKEDLRQEKYEAFHEEVLNQLNIDKLLECKTSDDVNELLGYEVKENQ